MSVTRHQRLAAFQTAVAAHTAGLPNDALEEVLAAATRFVSDEANRLRRMHSPVTVSLHAMRELAYAHDRFYRTVSDNDALPVDAHDFAELDGAIRDAVPWQHLGDDCP